MIIVIKDKDSVWMGISAGTGNSKSACKEDAVHEDNIGMWRADGNSHCIVAVSGGVAPDVDQIRYREIPELLEPLDQRKVITEFIPEIKKNLLENDMVDDEGYSFRTFVIASEDRAFEINKGFTCVEIEDVYALPGDGGYLAYGGLKANPDLPPEERITEAFRVAEKFGETIQFPIVIMNTKTNDRKVVYSTK